MRKLTSNFRTCSTYFNGKKVFNKNYYFIRRLQSTALPEQDVPLRYKKKYGNKIIYSESISKFKKFTNREVDTSNRPICLQYFVEEEKANKKGEDEEEVVQFPYEIKMKFKEKPTIDKSVTKIFSNSIVNLTPFDNEKVEPKSLEQQIKEADENKLESVEIECTINDNIEDSIRFGTCDPKIPISSIPCGGCGALLQCCDRSIPGFLPKEVFFKKSKNLQAELCQRCYFLKEFDVALGVNVSPSEYPNIIKQIRHKNALAIILVDIFDFPCSIWPGIMNLIGSKPVIVVGNKADLLIQEGKGCKHYFKKCLESWLEEQGIDKDNIIDIALISAKTGYGVEELINKLYKHWEFKGDVYIIGCTNVGKSTLFNTLIQSDYCKVKASELIQKATISAWPGTTLNLLKFPIMAPHGWKLHSRVQRLISERNTKSAYEKLIQSNINFKTQQVSLSGYVGRTHKKAGDRQPGIDSFASDMSLNDMRPQGIDPRDHDFSRTKWCYDSPGVINHDQIVNFLTTPELLLTIPKSLLIPRNFYLRPATSLFIGGLARLDYVNGKSPVWFTVFASKELPITITSLTDASDLYKKFLGTDVFRVPFGGKARLKKWPEMLSKTLEITGKIKNEAVADIVLSSAGWVAITTPPAYHCVIEAWTPGGRGIYLRTPPIIKTGHSFRGKRIPGTPAFEVVMKEIHPFRINEKPELIK